MELGDARYLGVFQAATCELPAVIYSQPPLSASSTPSVSNFIPYQLLAPLAAISTTLLLSIISYSYLLLFTISFYYSQPLSSIFLVLSVIYYQLLSIICQVLRSISYFLFSTIYSYLPSTTTIYYFTSIHCHQLSSSVCPLYLNSHAAINSHYKS